MLKTMVLSLSLVVATAAIGTAQESTSLRAAFHLEEATIADLQQAIVARRITTVGLVELYLKRIKAYNGTCVKEPQGILGPITTIPHAGQLNALSTLNLRPATRKTWGFDDRKARSLTDGADARTDMPDALEVAAAQDRLFNQTGRLAGPLHGVVISVPAGFTTEVWDRVREGTGTRLAGPIAARLPVGVDFVGRPFDEPMLFRIASAYEGATRHRTPPHDFGPLAGEP